MKYFTLLIFTIALTSFESFGQVYEKIYSVSGPEIQQKMDQNKIAGVDILSGIKTHHVIGLTGVGTARRSELENLLNNDTRIISFVLSADATSVILDSQASLTKEELNTIIQEINGVITGYTAEYTINE